MKQSTPSSKRREVLIQLAWILADSVCIAAATAFAALVRFDFSVSEALVQDLAIFAALAIVVHVALCLAFGPYRIDHLRGSFEETSDLVRAGLISLLILAASVFVFGWPTVPRSLAIATPVFALLGMFVTRFVIRSFRWGRTTENGQGKRVVIYGAGEGGRQLVRAMVRDASDKPYVPVALIDDDPRKRRLRMDGVRVRGDRTRLKTVVEQTEPEALVVAIPSASRQTLLDISEEARALGLEVLLLPPVQDLIGPPKGADLRQLNLEDLLGRGRVELDAGAITESIAGKRVLVTGAGGSIGSELCRQIHRFGPAKLVLLDRDESALHAAQMSLTGRALLDDGTLALCDIRDPEALREVFEREQPQIVFHAAALKHLTLLEQFPMEAWKTNILGTLNVLEAAHRVGVGTFVNISTDKAAHPTCVLGYSKRVAERLTARFADRDDNTYVSVRFGNVLGSRGSVITAFTAQIERGGPVTVTHPDVERYFMLIPEACQLVLQAAAIGNDGEVMVLDMGEPMKIVDVAKTLIDMSGKRDVDIVYTGLRPGEKMSEVLFSPGENIQQSAHALVNHVAVPPIQVREVRTARHDSGQEAFDWMLRESNGVVVGEAISRA